MPKFIILHHFSQRNPCEKMMQTYDLLSVGSIKTAFNNELMAVIEYDGGMIDVDWINSEDAEIDENGLSNDDDLSSVDDMPVIEIADHLEPHVDYFKGTRNRETAMTAPNWLDETE